MNTGHLACVLLSYIWNIMRDKHIWECYLQSAIDVQILWRWMILAHLFIYYLFMKRYDMDGLKQVYIFQSHVCLFVKMFCLVCDWLIWFKAFNQWDHMILLAWCGCIPKAGKLLSLHLTNVVNLCAWHYSICCVVQVDHQYFDILELSWISCFPGLTDIFVALFGMAKRIKKCAWCAKKCFPLKWNSYYSKCKLNKCYRETENKRSAW